MQHFTLQWPGPKEQRLQGTWTPFLWSFGLCTRLFWDLCMYEFMYLETVSEGAGGENVRGVVLRQDL